MSHLADVRLRVTDLEALAIAGQRFGLVLKVGQTHYRWYESWLNDWHDASRAAALRGHDPKTFGHCDHALAQADNPSGYEVGLVPALDGYGYDLLYDAYMGGKGLEQKCGVRLQRLAQEYACVTTERTLARQGYKTARVAAEGGYVQVVATR